MKLSVLSSSVFLANAVLGTAVAGVDFDVNFAFGGAQTNGANRLLDCFGGILRPCDLVAQRREQLDAAGLVLSGISQQIDHATTHLQDDAEGRRNRDLYMLFAGNNDFYGPYPSWQGEIPPAFDAQAGEVYHPLMAAWSVQNLASALERIATTLDAKFIVVPNVVNPCSLPFCDKLQYIVGEATAGAIRAYSAVWTVQFDQGIRDVVRNFNAAHPNKKAIFVDVSSNIEEQLGSGNFVTTPSCQDVLYSGETIPDPVDGVYDCGNFAFVDDVHPTSAVWVPVANAIVDAVSENVPPGLVQNFERLIAFGDSFTDKGSYQDTASRTNVTWGETAYAPPAKENAAVNGIGLIEMIEEQLGLGTSAPFFQQSTLP